MHDITSAFNSAYKETQTNDRLEFYICWNNPGHFGLGYYNVYAKVNGVVKDQFVIDYRTSVFPEDWQGTGGSNGDINIDFDVEDEEFYYQNTEDPFPYESSIYCSIWGLKEHIDHETTEFEPYEPESLWWYKFYDHPRLQWSHSSNQYDYVTHYEIHRNEGSGWDLIDTRPSILLHYVDWEIDLGEPPVEEYLYYKVRSKNGSRVSDNFSNVVKVAGPGEFRKQTNGTVSESGNIYEWKLEQNFPNPFNPNTTISFSLRDNSFVTLKVFDILGREVTTLLKDRLNAGKHQVQLDGTNLDSGIYFYEIKTDKFQDMKKLLLLK